MSATRSAWAYLNRVVEGPSRALQAHLAAGRSAEELARGIRTRASWLGPLGPETEARHAWQRAEEDLAAAELVGGRLVTPDDADWPAEALDHAFGFAATGLSEHLRTYQSDAVAPHGLWVRGPSLTGAFAQAVGVVGTRASSAYGRTVTAQLVRGLAPAQWTILSGGALGVDAVAHEAALSVGGRTVVVAACGLDQTYPKAHRDLFARVTDSGGAVITEYPPGTTPQRHRFLTRNRLVAALSAGTVVIEAGWRSGALNTLSWAEALGRIPMAVPGPVTNAASSGCHARLREHRAQLVTSAEDVRALLETLGSVDADAQYELAFAPDQIQRLSRNELRVYDALPVHGGADADRIAAAAGLPLPLTIHLLLDLERRGILVREGNDWRRAGLG